MDLYLQHLLLSLQVLQHVLQLSVLVLEHLNERAIVFCLFGHLLHLVLQLLDPSQLSSQLIDVILALVHLVLQCF